MIGQEGIINERDRTILDVVLKWYYSHALERQKELATIEEMVKLRNRTIDETDELFLSVVDALLDLEMK